MSERLIRLLAELPPAEPDPEGAERIRMRCRARLTRQAPRASASRALPGTTDRAGLAAADRGSGGRLPDRGDRSGTPRVPAFTLATCFRTVRLA